MTAKRDRSGVRTRISTFARRRLAIAGVALAAVAMLCIPVSASSAQFVWNLSPSAPAGLYRIAREDWKVGDRVAVLTSPDLAADLDRRGVLRMGKLLVKRVVATSGDKVCRRGNEVSVNARAVAIARNSGSDGAPLPSWQGCATLGDSEVFLLGDTPDSYDGRYFGIISTHHVIGRAVALTSSR